MLLHGVFVSPVLVVVGAPPRRRVGGACGVAQVAPLDSQLRVDLKKMHNLYEHKNTLYIYNTYLITAHDIRILYTNIVCVYSDR